MISLFRHFQAHRTVFYILLLAVLFFSVAAFSTAPPIESVLGNLRPNGDVASWPAAAHSFKGSLTVLTLNVAHGRGTAFSQVFQRKETTRGNLKKIIALFAAHAADFVAIQEADAPSRWSGNMDHVAMLAKGAGYRWYAHAIHVSNPMAVYGTALLSRLPFVDAEGYTFQPSPPTLNKGFVWGRFNWQPNPENDTVIHIDIISVHLDFSRQSARTGQIEEIIEYLKERDNPLIILGDFNSEWLANGSVVRMLSSRAGLAVYRPEATDLGTYDAGKRRLDWILISNDLEFTRYAVIPDVVSDHMAVVAEVRMKQSRGN